MNLDTALDQFDRVEANIAKLSAVWDRLLALIPEGIVFCGGSPEDREYRSLSRDFDRLLPGLPPIDGWSITAHPLNLDEIAQNRLDAREIDEPAAIVDVEHSVAAPGLQLDEYRSRLRTKRHQLVRTRIGELSSELDSLLMTLARPLVSRDDCTTYRDVNWERLEQQVAEVDRLFGPTRRSQAWVNLRRHLAFATGTDLWDIKEHDWPAIKKELAALVYDQGEPLPVDVADLGTLAASAPTGPVSTALCWEGLDAETFERVVFSIINDTRGYENASWLMHTNAPDQGRDLAVWRVHDDPLAGTLRERLIIQCKHWLARSVRDVDLSEGITKMAHWEPPAVDVLVFATSGRFTTDAVHWQEKHNHAGKRPRLELWAESTLERQLAQRPHLVVTFKLR